MISKGVFSIRGMGLLWNISGIHWNTMTYDANYYGYIYIYGWMDDPYVAGQILLNPCNSSIIPERLKRHKKRTVDEPFLQMMDLPGGSVFDFPKTEAM